MRIGIDLRTLQEKHKAGIGHYAQQLCRSLLNIDKVNEYYFYFNSFRKIDIPKFCQPGKVILNQWPTKIVNLSSRFFNHPQIDKFSNLDLFWQPTFNFISLSDRVKKVITVHDLSWLINSSWYSKRMLWWHKLQPIKNVLLKASKIVAVSNNTKQDIIYFFKVPADKISVIKSGVEVEDKTDFANQFNLPDKYLLYIGTVEPRKNVSAILEAMENVYQQNIELVDTHLVLIGSQGWANKEVWQKLKNSPYRDNFHYLGYVTLEQKNGLIYRSLGLIWPSFYEGFSFPPLEALLRQKPVITSFSSSLPEVVKDKAVMINPYNINDLIEAILKLLQGDSVVLAKDELAIWQDEYDWHNVARKYLQLFNRL